ncbi:hypothetical protein AB4Z18_02070 [Leifsonia sp. 2TAF2]|uniref:hypothetical protein n=1 Tax=Leifsonia sp. 2TAF2 TaxID=3233009 RepID=UPI003F9C7971
MVDVRAPGTPHVDRYQDEDREGENDHPERISIQSADGRHTHVPSKVPKNTENGFSGSPGFGPSILEPGATAAGQVLLNGGSERQEEPTKSDQ